MRKICIACLYLADIVRFMIKFLHFDLNQQCFFMFMSFKWFLLVEYVVWWKNGFKIYFKGVFCSKVRRSVTPNHLKGFICVFVLLL